MIALANFWYLFMPVMADATGGDDHVSLKALGAFLAVVITAVGTAFFAKKKGVQQGAAEERKRKVVIEEQPVGIKIHAEFVTHGELGEHIERIEGDISGIRNSLEGERSVARTANGNLHKRIDALSERLGDRLSKLEGSVEGIAGTTDKLLDIALAKKPGTRN